MENSGLRSRRRPARHRLVHGLRHAARDDMPAIQDALHIVPATTNPLGVKGAGEAGTTAAIAAVMNAIADAIPGGAGADSTCRRRRRRSGRRPRGRLTRAKPLRHSVAGRILAPLALMPAAETGWRIFVREANPCDNLARSADACSSAASCSVRSPQSQAQSPYRTQRTGHFAQEAQMEACWSAARRSGSTITTTVVTNAAGPPTASRPRASSRGKYTISIRAIGYSPRRAQVGRCRGRRRATADLKLSQAKNLPPALQRRMAGQPAGPDSAKAFLTDCVGCHTLQRVFTSTHDADEFKQVFMRMGALFAWQHADASAAAAAGAARRATARRPARPPRPPRNSWPTST